MRLDHLTPAIGSVVHDVDFKQTISLELANQIREQLYQRGVLFFPNQHLSAAELLLLAKVFGEPVASPHPKFGCVDGVDEVSLVINDEDNPPDINVWHSDLSYYQEPATTCVLQCQETPVTGGDTIWSSMVSAYESLSDPLKNLVDNSQAYHQLPLDGYPSMLIKQALKNPISAVHSMARTIPETGKRALFVNRVYTHSIENISKVESDGLLNSLFSHAESPDYQVRFKWAKGTVAIWDNRSTQHFAVADYFPQRRVMYRVAIKGEALIGSIHENLESQ
ncbi:MAG: TauD/TfdA family dioxygenase [Arenicella sp.]|nr:TauD/TfdA family dioxygenase [Arenicella sp.]